MSRSIPSWERRFIKGMSSDLSDSNLATLTLAGLGVLLYVMNYIYAQVPRVTKMVLDTFGVAEENKLSEQMADDAQKLVGLVVNGIKSVGSTIINGGEKKSEDKPKEANKGDGKK